MLTTQRCPLQPVELRRWVTKGRQVASALRFDPKATLEQFGDAEMAAMVAPRRLIVEAGDHPNFNLPPRTGGNAPAKLVTPDRQIVFDEVKRARKLLAGWPAGEGWLDVHGDGGGTFGRADTLTTFLAALNPGAKLIAAGKAPTGSGRRNPDGQGFAAFGRITSGMRVVRRIQQQQDTEQYLDSPVPIQVIRRK